MALSIENLGINPMAPTMEQVQNLENESIFRRILELLKNGQFVFLTLAISSLYFVVTGL
jgi:acyl CoA:acetate/3-ketoacid CoA transferase beta subunit